MAYRGACHFIFMFLFEPDVCIDWPHARLNCPTLVVVILAFAKELVGQQRGIGRGHFPLQGFHVEHDYCEKWSLNRSSYRITKLLYKTIKSAVISSRGAQIFM